MFCPKCSKSLSDDCTFCTECGTSLYGGTNILPNTPFPSINPSANVMRDTSSDAWDVIRTIAINPVGGLLPAYTKLGEKRALNVGIIFGTTFFIMTYIGLYWGLSKIMSRISLVARIGMVSFRDIPFKTIIKIIILLNVPFISFIISIALARKVGRGEGSLAGDIFIAGTALLPGGIFILFAPIFGLANLEIIIATYMFVLCYVILILFTGCHKIARLSECSSALAVPIIILIEAWSLKVAISMMFF